MDAPERRRPAFTRIVEGLPSTVPFVGPEAQERARGRAFRARIGANESVFGPSPAAIEAMRRAAPEQWMYCDPNIHDLRQALARHHGLPPECIVIGEGPRGTLRWIAGSSPAMTTKGRIIGSSDPIIS